MKSFTLQLHTPSEPDYWSLLKGVQPDKVWRNAVNLAIDLLINHKLGIAAWEISHITAVLVIHSTSMSDVFELTYHRFKGTELWRARIKILSHAWRPPEPHDAPIMLWIGLAAHAPEYAP